MTHSRGASDTRLMGQGPFAITEPTWDWTRDAFKLAARALELVANDPFAAAMVQCKLDNTHGPEGLRPVSLAQYDDHKSVTTEDHALRQTLERGWAGMSGTAFDVEGMVTRKAFDRQLDYLATVCGECFAIRCWKPNRKRTPFATCWRLVRMERVSNPDGRPNDVNLYHGFELDDGGEVVAIWVETTKVGAFASWHQRTWARVPWYSDDGTPNVVHRVGWRIPGMRRAISMFMPMLLLARQVGGTIDAHVTAKRAQAVNPIIYFVDDPEAAAAASAADSASVLGPHTKLNPLQVYFAKIGNQVQFNNTNFNGQDLEAFLKICFRILCSVWQMPVEVVLCQMGDSSLASARAGLDQVDRTAQNWQGDHIEQAGRPFDMATTAELIVMGTVTPGSAGIAGLSIARYSRPPKYSTDRLKDANTVKALMDAGVSPTTALATVGLDFEDETDQAVRDELYRQNARASAKLVPPAEDMLREAQASVALIASGLSNFQIEIAKRGQQYGPVWEQLLTEQKQAKDMGLVLDLSGSNAPAEDSTLGKDDKEEEEKKPPAKAAAPVEKSDPAPAQSAPVDVVALATAIGDSLATAIAALPQTVNNITVQPPAPRNATVVRDQSGRVTGIEDKQP